ncbi:site-specific integrase [Mucilaginibacter sp.]|uniref:site-specific integrase n=1 Tax=Mucilaginibacter sp. TaxID=1882438 RepID=UPI0026132AEC|nr:site-specific integrase [Mucilaginibacter sp.]MDB5129404.1 site-specific integrase [Mucilaginibacter sp.]
MSVKLRKRSISGNRYSLYLDIYENSTRSYEFLKIYILKKPRTPLETQSNKDNLKLAETIKAKRELEINSHGSGYVPRDKQKVNFLLYFENFSKNYTKKDVRLVWGAYNYFKVFVNVDYLKPGDITEDLLIRFKEFLESKLKGETPANYFSKLKKVLRQAHKEKVFIDNPALYIVNKKNDNIKKDILTAEEIQILASTNCSNAEVKRAFLFSCITGLRFCDIARLAWQSIHGDMMKITQQKTNVPALINLNSTAIKILGTRANNKDLVFSLPSHTACLKHLRNWVCNAKITKKITWHCARHSFGTNLLFYGTDAKTASGLLGHTSMKYTERYLHIADSRKEQAINNLPEIIF